MPKKFTLTNENIAKLETAPKGTRYDVWDTVVPGFAVRVTDTGAKSFSLSAKLPGATNTTRLTIDKVGVVPLKVAREMAREWLGLIADGFDPRSVVRAARAAKAAEIEATEETSFRNRAEAYLEASLSHLRPRQKYETARVFRSLFIPALGDRQVASITTADCHKLIAKMRKTPGSARPALSYLKTFFAWLAMTGAVPFSPAAVLSSVKVIGKPNKGKRVFTDAELKAMWQAALALPYPIGPHYLLLILTGCRLMEIGGGHWDEIKTLQNGDRVWLIPDERMKMGRAHAVPLTPLMLDVLAMLPHKSGFMFSHTGGATPITWKQKSKLKMDAACGFSDWVNHDLRRTMRSRLSVGRLGIPFEIRERMIAHAIGGLVDVYDHHSHHDEMRDGFLKWNAEVVRLTGGLPKRIKLVA